jgi:predicted ATPase
MLTKWTVENFKSIYEPTPIVLAPLTIFAGANSSGKSTIIQSILLTAQTIQSPVHSKSVVLNGHILRLGAFDDIVSNTREKPKSFETRYLVSYYAALGLTQVA